MLSPEMSGQFQELPPPPPGPLPPPEPPPLSLPPPEPPDWFVVLVFVVVLAWEFVLAGDVVEVVVVVVGVAWTVEGAVLPPPVVG
ncbi:MAG: hypothetical protein Tsb0019_35300 [Roseibium sp.]